MHSSDPVTPYLGARARVRSFRIADLDAPLYDTRRLWRMHAMRRTLFVVPAAEAGMVLAGACSRYASRERDRVVGWLSEEMDPAAVPAWLDEVESDTLATVAAADDPLPTGEIAERVPALTTGITLGSGRWTTRSPLSSRLLFLLALEGRIVRARPVGTWRSSQYRWAAVDGWFDSIGEPPDPAEGRAELARRYLERFGPVTADDLRWWAGLTKRQTLAALEAAGAVPVGLDGGGEGFVAPGDLASPEPAPGTVAFLPGLDPTPMGWTDRAWYLAGHDEVFDSTGNVGPTVWAGGRIVGGWAQRPDAEVVWRLLEDVGTDVADRIAAEAGALTEWLDGTVVSTRFPGRLEGELTDGA